MIFLLFLRNSSFGKSYFLNDRELLITMNVFDSFEVRQCIIVRREMGDNVILKEFSKKNIMSLVKSLEELLEYFKKGSFVNVKTMILVKEKNSGKIGELFQVLKKVSFFLLSNIC